MDSKKPKKRIETDYWIRGFKKEKSIDNLIKQIQEREANYDPFEEEI